MIIKTYRQHFNASLSNIYPDTEIDTFFFLLIEAYLELQRIDISLQPNFEIDPHKLDKLNKALHRLSNEEPIQYILGETEFYGLPFLLNEYTLIPRPETEELVNWILDDLSSMQSKDLMEIIDIGTGSGCIPISICKNHKEAKISAVDISLEALDVARRNAETNKVTIDFIHTDILTTDSLPSMYNIIISNPPYVRNMEKVEIKNNVLKNEPHLALFVEDHEPLIFYDKIGDLAKKHLKEEGALYFEINQYLGKETVALLKEKGFKQIELRKDLFGNDRMIKAKL